EVVRTATGALLEINDGPQHENVSLDLSQLRNGSIVYSPVTPDVSFRLHVTSSNPALSQSENLRVLNTGGKPSPVPTPSAPQPAPAPKPTVSAPEVPVAPRPQPRAFDASNLESPATRLRSARPSDLPEPPSAGEATLPSGTAVPSTTISAPA